MIPMDSNISRKLDLACLVTLVSKIDPKFPVVERVFILHISEVCHGVTVCDSVSVFRTYPVLLV
jgi:hypothetical protein